MMTKDIRDHLATKVRDIVKRNKKGQLKYRDVVFRYLEDLLGCGETQTLGYHGRWGRALSHTSHNYKYNSSKIFLPFRVIVYFPWEGVKIVLTREQAENIDYFKRILSETFENKEKPIAFKFIEGYRRIIDGPLLIISMASTNSIILEDGKTLRESFAKV